MRGERIPTERPLEDTWEVGVLYGRTLFDGDRATVTASAGVGFVGGMRRGDFWYTEELGTEPTKIIPRIRRSIDVYARDRFGVVSLPVEVRLHARPADLFGADFLLFGSLNRVDTYGGLAVQVRLGPVR
jgi:hypothetical protein